MSKQYLIIISADTNDGDYVHDLKEVSESEYNETYKDLLSKVSKAISKRGGTWGRGEIQNRHNDPRIIYKDVLTEEEIDAFDYLAPHGEYGIHSIGSITVYSVGEKVRLY
jgi:hypothetical protein